MKLDSNLIILIYLQNNIEIQSNGNCGRYLRFVYMIVILTHYFTCLVRCEVMSLFFLDLFLINEGHVGNFPH